jgi:hypothetical protein
MWNRRAREIRDRSDMHSDLGDMRSGLGDRSNERVTVGSDSRDRSDVRAKLPNSSASFSSVGSRRFRLPHWTLRVGDRAKVGAHSIARFSIGDRSERKNERIGDRSDVSAKLPNSSASSSPVGSRRFRSGLPHWTLRIGDRAKVGGQVRCGRSGKVKTRRGGQVEWSNEMQKQSGRREEPIY